MSSLFNLTPNIIPYNLSLLQDIEVDTINGDTYQPFNGVVSNTNYPLIYNSTTGILSQTAIDQNLNQSSNVSFSSIKCNTLLAPSTILNTVKIGGSGSTAGQPLTGYNYIRITTTSTSTGGASLAFMTGNDSYRGNIGADTGYIYITSDASSSQGVYLNASGLCRLASINSIIDFFVAGVRRGSVSSTLMDMLVPITSSGKITGLSLQAPTHIFTGAGVGVASIIMPNTSTSYTLTLPTGLPSVAGLPLISSLTGELSYNNQAVSTTNDVQFNSVRCGLLSAVSTSATTVKIGGAGLTPGHPLNGYNYVRVQTTATTSGGGGFAFMTGIDGYRGNIGADGGWIYVTADANTSQGIYFAASGLCRMGSAYSVVEFYVGFSTRGTVSTTLMNMSVPITSSGKITGLSLQAATHIFTGAGVGIASIVMPNTATSYTLNLPTGLPSVAGAPLISSLTGTLSYNNQAVSTTDNVTFNSVNIATGQTYKINNVSLNIPNQVVNTTSDVTFNSVNARITDPYLVYASWLLGATPSLLTNTNTLTPITTPAYRYISYAPNLPTESNWVNQGGVFASPTYGFTSGTPRLRVPFNGMYQISTTIDIPVYTFVFPNNNTYYQSLMNAFISKNAQNNNDLDGSGCLVSGTLNNSSSPYTARSINLSCQVYLTTSDYICIGLYSEITIPATDLGPRCTLHISLVQRI